MGGCRCSYRNCQATSDGTTHFFHYPVFDKARCHQWLDNSSRYDLLDLKLSQLRNRVVCQRHFRDDMFMNYMKDKLTNFAVPSKDGPVSLQGAKEPMEPSNTNTATKDQSPLEVNQIAGLDDTKYFTVREKAATFSVPYRTFLENGNLDTLNDPNLLQSLQGSKKKTLSRPLRGSMSKINIPSPVKTTPEKESMETTHQINPHRIKPEKVFVNTTNKRKDRVKNVIIISEEKLTQPLPVHLPATLKKVSPSLVLKAKPKHKNNNGSGSKSISEQSKGFSEVRDYLLVPEQEEQVGGAGVLEPVAPAQLLAVGNFTPRIISATTEAPNENACIVHPPNLPIEYVPEWSIYHEKTTGSESATVPENAVILENSILPEKMPQAVSKALINKSNIKVSPAKQAEIDKKRKFNMSVLERALEGDEKLLPTRAPSFPAGHNRQTRTQAVGSGSTQDDLSEVNSTLLSTVEENRRDIAEIKRILLGQGPPVAKPVAALNKHSQTGWSEVATKNYLFEEISRYLSPSLKSAVYEELFLKTVASKRRKVNK